MDLAALVCQVILQHSEVPSQLVEKYSPEASLMLETGCKPARRRFPSHSPMRGAVEVSHSHPCSATSSPEQAEPPVRSARCKSPWPAPVQGVLGFVGALTTACSRMLPCPSQ